MLVNDISTDGDVIGFRNAVGVGLIKNAVIPVWETVGIAVNIPCQRFAVAAAGGSTFLDCFVLAMTVVTEYCRYLAVACTNLITQLDIRMLILSGSSRPEGHFFPETLARLVNEKVLIFSSQPCRAVQSGFGADSPLYGSVGMLLDRIFRGELSPLPQKHQLFR